MPLKISVVPAGDGWAVRSAGFENDMLFAAGAKAAQSGATAEVAIYLRNGALAGRFLHPAAAQPEAIPA
jgi:hypothetical protein